MDRGPKTKELQREIVTHSLATMLGSLIGGLPAAIYGQNVGIVIDNKVINTHVFAAVGTIMVIAGFIPKFAALMTSIPQPGIEGSTINAFGVIAITGIKVLCNGGHTHRRATIAGASVSLGIGNSGVAGCLSGPGMPSMVAAIFESAIVVPTFIAIILNFVLSETFKSKHHRKLECKHLNI